MNHNDLIAILNRISELTYAELRQVEIRIAIRRQQLSKEETK